MPPDLVTRSEAIDPAIVGRERPIFDKQNMTILRDGDQLDLYVNLSLDFAQPDELAAKDLAPDGHLDLKYRVELDLEAEREGLAKRFAEIYHASEIAVTLRQDELVVLNNEVYGDKLRKAMMPIALQGRSVHRRLFQPEKFSHFFGTDADIVRKALRSALRRDGLITIHSPVSLFPWMFLYDDERLQKDNRSTLELGRFWGFRHQIQDEIEGASGHVLLANPPQIAAAISPDVDVNNEHRAGPLGQFAAKARDQLHWITSAEELRKILMKFTGDCIYFFGHAFQDNPPTPTTSVLRLDGFDVTVEDISAKGPPEFAQPLVLVFLNGCETSPLHKWNEGSFVGRLCRLGNNRVCCITSFAEVPQALARQFARHFWEHFLIANETVGAAMLHARRDLLDAFGNPLGLLYALFGRIETRIG